MFKKILKNTLWVGLILSLGQIPIGPKTVGRHFIEGLGNSFIWSGHSLLTTKWLAGMDHPEWLDKLFEVERSPHPEKKNNQPNLDHLNERDREQVRKILE